MAYILPSTAYPRQFYPASPLVQRQDLNTISEDDSEVPRYYFQPRYSTISTSSTLSPQAALMSPVSSEDFPTPRANFSESMKSPARTGQTDSYFDDLYDITDDEEEVPLKCSASVKSAAKKNRYPSIVIPSPSAWPTIEKLKSALTPVAPTPTALLSPSANALSMITARNLQVPASSATPSLDGSMTSEEMDRLSCPSTPDQSNKEASDEERWAAPVQLHPQAFETLRHLQAFASDEQQGSEHATQLIEVPEGEMQEVVTRPQLNLTVPSDASSGWGSEPVSALSIPSPGGFLSSLSTSARHTWSFPKAEDSMPTTTTAEKFYSLPWDMGRTKVVEQTVTLDGSTLDGFSDGLPTAKPVTFTREDDEVLEVKEINPSKTVFQYSEKYHAELQKVATVNLGRTEDWLSEQDELQALLREMNVLTSPKTPTSNHSRGNSLEKSPGKKSVRFQVAEKDEEDEEEEKPKKNVTYVQGWEFLNDRSRKNDAFIHRQTRAEAMHVQRRCMAQAHRDQLLGKFELTHPVRPSPPRPVSEFYTDDPTVLKERIARAQMERQALDQMLPRTWYLQALKQLNGGKLLSRAASRHVWKIRSPRILDVGGIPTNDWAWQVCYDNLHSTVTTVYTQGNNLTSNNVTGPDNHKHTVVPNLWTLPFPSGHFDVVSARSLYELLKTDKPLGRSMDEYDLCLKECYRCLKPGGYLDFSLIDADIIQGGQHAQAMGVEFGFNLKTRGYDAAPTKAFLPRLNKAGFKGVQRTWMVLPMGKTAANWRDVLPVGAEPKEQEKTITPDGDVQFEEREVIGTTLDAAMMTGMVGSWQYERWLLKLQVEMGKPEEKLLEGVVPMLEEGARDGAGWRYLTGYARKQ